MKEKNTDIYNVYCKCERCGHTTSAGWVGVQTTVLFEGTEDGQQKTVHHRHKRMKTKDNGTTFEDWVCHADIVNCNDLPAIQDAAAVTPKVEPPAFKVSTFIKINDSDEDSKIPTAVKVEQADTADNDVPQLGNVASV